MGNDADDQARRRWPYLDRAGVGQQRLDGLTSFFGGTMSTDTAFALGLLALEARGLPDLVRIFLLTVVVVDDLVAPVWPLQRAYHPWTSYVIVPLFALANAGIEISEEFLVRAATSPITLVSSRATWSASRPASSAPPGSSAGSPGATADPGRLGRARRDWRNRRHRIHRLAADSQPLTAAGNRHLRHRHPHCGGQDGKGLTPLGTTYVDVALDADGAESNQLMRS
jgi:hypothetical protein